MQPHTPTALGQAAAMQWSTKTGLVIPNEEMKMYFPENVYPLHFEGYQGKEERQNSNQSETTSKGACCKVAILHRHAVPK